MTKIEPIIGVKNVAKSSLWYQTVLELKSNHGGDAFEMLTNEKGATVLCLHLWGEHEHPTLSEPKKDNGNGLILYFRVNDLEPIWKNAIQHKVTIEFEPRLNENSHCKEFALRDLDGYYLLISE